MQRERESQRDGPACKSSQALLILELVDADVDMHDVARDVRTVDA